MGIYDNFEIPGSSNHRNESNHVQLKNGLCECIDYSIGDDVPLDDGVYLSDNGVVVIINKKYTFLMLLISGEVYWSLGKLLRNVTLFLKNF
ncbi:hypothetical protein LCGC14_1368370 [marine sediment metagenome]|uniref:Uncharacterized protein n=1 Tax=marine sediment metagenome TaxID=412755 RepID=A0A0F9N825_9ZZZZ